MSLINFRLILKIISQVLLLEAGAMLLPLSVAFMSDDKSTKGDGVFPFLIAMLVTAMAAFIMRYYGETSKQSIGFKEAPLLVTSLWIVLSFFGSFPFLLLGGFSWTDAFFETMSGFTTTGSTIIEDIESFPASIMLWRSITQWIGGLGIVFFIVAILPNLVKGGRVKVFSAEATGPFKIKMHPKISTSGTFLLCVYFTLTLLCALSFWACGMSWFDAVNHAMTTTATGGFSTFNDTTAVLGQTSVSIVMVVFMFFSGANFTALYATAMGKKNMYIWKNAEFLFYCKMIAVATILITISLMLGSKTNYGPLKAFGHSVFQVVSFATTTGSYNDSIQNWPRFAWFVLFVIMFIGGCAGSTAGGLKCVRALLLWKIVKNELKRILHPNAILPLKVNGKIVKSKELSALVGFTVVYVLLCIVTYGGLMMFEASNSDIDTVDGMTIAMSSACNVGPSLLHTPSDAISWSTLSAPSKWMCAFLMLLGRLEILNVLVIFTPSFWTNRV